MAIDLPPDTPPALAEAQEIRNFQHSLYSSGHQPIATEVAGYEVLVHGNTQLTTDEVKRRLSKGNNLSDAVWHLHYAYQEAGHRLTRIRYLLKNNQLHVHVIQGQINSISGEPALTRYFWDIDKRNFAIPLFEPRRTLANIQAERLGMEVQASYVPQSPASDQIHLNLQTTPSEGYKPWKLKASIGNPGNRFVGRHYLTTEGSWNLPSAQWKLDLNKSISDLDDSDDGNGRLFSYQLSGSSITPIGFVGFGYGQNDYSYEFEPDRHLLGEVRQAQILLQEIVSADLDKRTILSQRLKFIDNQVVVRESNQVLRDERYYAIELGAKHNQRLSIFGKHSLIGVELKLAKGLSTNKGTLGVTQNGLTPDARFFSIHPEFTLSTTIFSNYEAKIIAQSQFSDRQPPEQQQWYLGGPKRMRAWLPGSLLGDEGHYLAFEFLLPEYNLRDWLLLSPQLFVEAGQASFKEGMQRRQRAYDIGASVALSMLGNWELELASAYPISKENLIREEDYEAKLFFTLSSEW